MQYDQREMGYADEDSLYESGSKRRRMDDSSEPDYNPSSVPRRPVGSGEAKVELSDAASIDLATKRGMAMYKRVMNLRDAHDYNRLLATVFMQVPDRTEYPDYYAMIKKPIDLEQIKAKLEARAYTSLLEVNVDFNQVFVNAKRFNAPGSSIFLDAKKLHKLTKDTFIAMTTDGYVTEVDPPRRQAPPPGSSRSKPAPKVHLQQQPASHHKQQQASRAITPSVLPSTVAYFNYDNPTSPSELKKGPTLKPWLTNKLVEINGLVDIEGRKFSESFKTLPVKSQYPAYYRVVSSPISLDQVAAKCLKRAYLSVEQFIDDINRCFANAQYFNDESSRIWHDAGIMQQHFEKVMAGPRPIFPAPRQYNTVRKRVEEEAKAMGLPIPEHKTNKRKNNRRSQSQSEPAEDRDYDDSGSEMQSVSAGGDYMNGMMGGRFDSTAPAELDSPRYVVEDEDARSRSGTPAIVSAGSNPYPQYPGSPSVLAYPYINGQSPTLAGLAGVPDAVLHPPKAVSRLVTRGELPAITQFVVRTSPLTTDILLTCDKVRQHSFSVPFDTDRVDFVPVFRYEATSPKRNSKEANGETEHPRIVAVNARPYGTRFEAAAVASEKRYSLYPAAGLTTVEFTVMGLVGDDGAEVYRMFVRK